MQKHEELVLESLRHIEEKMDFLEREVVTIKSWLSEDERLTPYEKKLIEDTIRKVKNDKTSSMPTIEDMRKRAGA